VLPLAVATELMAEAAQATWTELTVTGVRDLQLLKGIVIDTAPVPLVIAVRMPVYSREALQTDATVEIRVPGQTPAVRYRAVVELSGTAPEPPSFAGDEPHLAPLPLPLDDAYRRWTFHGPLFQRLVAIDGLGPDAMLGHAYSSSGITGIADIARAEWIIDPFVFDAALQMLLIWSRAQNDKTALPSRFRAFRRYRGLSDRAVTCHVRVESAAGGHGILSDISFLDANGTVLGELDGMEATCSSALNRLATS
jgi:hypothetical protein